MKEPKVAKMGEVESVSPERQIHYKERTFYLERPNYETQGKYSSFVIRKAVQAAEYFRNEPSYDGAVEAITRDIATFQYDWGRTNIVRSLSTEQGFKELIFITLLQRHNPAELTRKFYDEELWPAKGVELGNALNELMSPTPTMPPVPVEGEATA